MLFVLFFLFLLKWKADHREPYSPFLSRKADYAPAGECAGIKCLSARAQRGFQCRHTAKWRSCSAFKCLHVCLFMAGTVSVLAKSLCAISGSPEITNKGSSFFLQGALRATFRLYEWKTMVTIEINAQHTLLHKPVSGISAPTSSSLDSWMHCFALFLPLVFKFNFQAPPVNQSCVGFPWEWFIKFLSESYQHG